MMNEYLINSFLHVIHAEGFLNFIVPGLPLTTTELDLIVKLQMHGWELGCPC